MITSRMPQTLTALEYHRGTNHPDGELLDYRHGYHPGMRPTLFKRYRGLPALEIQIGKPASEPPALTAIGHGAEGGTQGEAQVSAGGDPAAGKPESVATAAAAGLTLTKLARLLHYSAGITKHLRGYAFRAAACTGALYHIELYVVCRELEGLPAGVYHYDPELSRLLRLREGDFRAALAEMSGGSEGVRGAPATLIYSDVFWRNAIKYQAREFRHAFWDSGTIVANTLSMATALQLPAQLVMGFVDDEVAQLLGLDPSEELPLALLTLGGSLADAEPAAHPPKPIELDWEPRTEASRVFPTIPRIHRASALESAEQVRDWRRAGGASGAGVTAGGEAESGDIVRSAEAGGTRQAATASQAVEGALELRFEPPAQLELPSDSLERVIVRRGSSRAFARQPIERRQLAALLDRALRPVPADYPRPERLVHPYLIVNAVEGLESGAYQVLVRDQTERIGLRQLRAGEYRRQAAELALGQALGGDAAADLYFLSPLEPVLARYGERGYRLAQMEAAVMAGWGYLAAYALGFGATGLTFYDELVEDFLGVSERGLRVMFLLAIGVPARA